MAKEVRSVSSTGGVKGTKLARFSSIPTRVLRLIAEHFGRGALKYADHNWRKGYEWSKSYDALMRHLDAFWDGEDYDNCPEDADGCSFVTADGEPFETNVPNTCYNHTGSLHMVAVAWHAIVMIEFYFAHPSFDDRYRMTAQRGKGGLTVEDVKRLSEKTLSDPKRFGGSVTPPEGGQIITNLTINNPDRDTAAEQALYADAVKKRYQALMNEAANRGAR